MDDVLDCKIYRRFGVEIELNTHSGVVKKLFKNQAPEGAQDIAVAINEATGQFVEVCGWHHTHYNNHWVVKPDSSCGIEVCSPILKGWTGLKSLLDVVECLEKNFPNGADERCSLHVHVGVEDLSRKVIGTILAWWIKCEPVFLDCVPECRKNNRYCQSIGVSSIFGVESLYDPMDILYHLADRKYYSANAFHLIAEKRKTIEFRIMDNSACLNPNSVKNWVRLILHFVETASKTSVPSTYEANNPWSSLCWLDPTDVFKFLNFDHPHLLSPGLDEVRQWFLIQLAKNISTSNQYGLWSAEGRKVAIQQVEEMVSIEDLSESFSKKSPI